MWKQQNIIFLSVGVIILGCVGYFLSPNRAIASQHTFSQIHSFKEAEQFLTTLKTGDCIFFDVDDTLLSSHDYLPRNFVPPVMFRLFAAIKHPRLIYERGYGEHVFSCMLQQAPRFLIEKSVIEIIEKLRQRGIIVMVITGMETGSFGSIKSMPDWRATMLEALGIKLDTQFKDTSFVTLPSYRSNYPTLHQGLICCNQQPKGPVIREFLQHFNLKPKTIIHFDDSHEELVSTKETCTQLNIAPQCYHYRGVDRIKHLPFSIRRSLTQLNHLIQHNKWLPDRHVESH